MALHKGECFAVRAAALKFLAVAMTVSSAQAAQETQLVPFTQLGSPPSSPCTHHLSAPGQDNSPAGLTAATLARLELASAEGDEGMQTRAMLGQGRRSLAGPLFLQSAFGARQYTQGIWDFGVEQLLLHGSFWEQVPLLLQVWPLPFADAPSV